MTKAPSDKPRRVNYRLRITQAGADVLAPRTTYIVRRGGTVEYITGAEIEQTLAGLVGEKAAELRFALEDALDGEAAAAALRQALADLHAGEPGQAPTVEVLPIG